MQDGLFNKLANIGGCLGGIAAKFLVITPMQILEVGLYGLIGSLIGEGVKVVFEYWKRKKMKK